MKDFNIGDTIIYKPNETNETYWFAEIVEIRENGKILIHFDREIYPQNYMYPQDNPLMIVSRISELYDVNDILFRRILK